MRIRYLDIVTLAKYNTFNYNASVASFGLPNFHEEVFPLAKYANYQKIAIDLSTVAIGG